MPRTIWEGTISFGMVAISVELSSAAVNKDISFHLLHKECDTRIKEYKWCPHCDRKVEWDELERGYEYQKGKYVKFTEEDFEDLPIASKKVINITSFVQLSEIDPIYYEKTYHLEPVEGSAKPFALLMKTLEEKNMAAVGSIAIRSKEKLCILRTLKSTLMLETLFYPDEILLPQAESYSSIKLSKSELDMAEHLVDLMAQPFDPAAYKDTYKEAVQQVIDAKLEGKEIVVDQGPAAATKVIDLMSALRASVNKAEGSKNRPRGSKRQVAKTRAKPASNSKRRAAR